ncbi:tetratricopeptide (TPR) repeat protein [Aliiruegeria haliotis]|uniref:Tetratricopeptide (TPR) repeat protein n=1 Tax=Aliiruegeria haliotis TaxID=1280846 RepID=A0A2T0RTB3_9RHOB|nr:tetratricopeptide repeat protein [Aliiruegeria haliotis]PRY24435.1 tetratricopeptide (TPR) repeat protein [Aliiruegeria haliotis]
MGIPGESGTSKAEGDASVPGSSGIISALEAILDSPEFEGAERVQAFLGYVVNETLQGRGESIRGKTIVEDVYGRSPVEGRDPMAVVRVDAGRLRRRLETYYAGSGANDEVRIRLTPGSYEPSFERKPLDGPAPETREVDLTPVPAPRRPWLLPAALGGLLLSGGILLLGVVGSGFWGDTERRTAKATSDRTEETARAVREALFSASPARLQAANLSAEARRLIFPALEPRWLAIVLQMFRLTIEMDPGFHGGYAGAAQVEALLAVSLPPGPERDGRIASASASAQRAMSLAIGESWSHSSAALVAFAQRDYAAALRSSSRALQLGPDDVHALTVDALVALFAGEFEHAIAAADRVEEMRGPTDRFPLLGIRGTANFHLGKYEAALELFSESALKGDPISPISLGYLIATNARLGNMDQAREMNDLLQSAWQGYPLDALYRTLFRDGAHAQDVIDGLIDAGWH